MEIVIYKQALSHHNGPLVLAGVRLEDGANYVSLADCDRLRSHPRWAHYLAAGILEIRPLSDAVPVPEDDESDDPTDLLSLVGFTVAQAVSIVEEETNIERLQRWQAADSRVTLQRTISDRIAQLQKQMED